MDEPRINAPDEDIRGYFVTLFSTVSGTAAHFIFNRDEKSHQRWADTQEMVCFVPADFKEPFVSFRVLEGVLH
jgi:hypothetical protein